MNLQSKSIQYQNMAKYPSLALPSEEGYILVKDSAILYCLAEGSYTHLYLSDNRRVKVCKKLKEVQEIIDNEAFVRIHHSHIVNLNHVKSFTDSDTIRVRLTNDMELTVSRSRRSSFFEKFTRL